MYKIGLSSCTKEHSFELFESFAKSGIELIEISRSSIEDAGKIDFSLLEEWSRKTGVQIWSFHLPFIPFSQIDLSKPELAEYSIEVCKSFIDKATKIGIKNFIVHASGEPIDDSDRKIRMETAKKSLCELATYADKFGATIAVEDLPRSCLGNCSSDILELMSAHEKLKACFDTNHLLSEDFSHFIHTVGDKIITTHISDYDYVNERHWMPGEGKVDWQGLLADLKEIGYDGPWLYEIDFHAPKTIIRERNFTCDDFVKNAREVFENKPITIISKPKEGLGYWE